MPWPASSSFIKWTLLKMRTSGRPFSFLYRIATFSSLDMARSISRMGPPSLGSLRWKSPLYESCVFRHERDGRCARERESKRISTVPLGRGHGVYVCTHLVVLKVDCFAESQTKDLWIFVRFTDRTPFCVDVEHLEGTVCVHEHVRSLLPAASRTYARSL